MKVPFLDLRQQYLELKNELDEAVARVLDSGWYILGHECEAFEHAFKEYLIGTDEGYFIGVNSGTDALKLSLLAAGVVPGDEVITVANTAIPTVTAICSIGAIPVFCDVNPDTWLMEASLIEGCITEKTRAIVPVHLYGSVCDMGRIVEIAKLSDLSVIEDVAQAAGARWRERACGTVADFGAFSFYPSKNLGACGDGGGVFVRSTEKRDLLLTLRNYGQSSRYNAAVPQGENSRLDEMQAAILSVKLRHLDRWNEKRRELARQYRAAFTSHGYGDWCQAEQEQTCPANHLFVIKTPVGRRETLMEKLLGNGIQTLIHYPYPLYRQPAFTSYFRAVNPVADSLCSSVLSLPFHQYLDSNQINAIVECIN